jgi:Na+-translocating ferredoxin:NAD+ oxidoreductase RnfD subunit
MHIVLCSSATPLEVSVITNSAVWRFLQTPKGLLLIVFAILLALAAPHERLRFVGPGLFSAVAVASAIDLAILRKLRGVWEFPSGAVLTGLIVAMILTPQEPWYVGASTAALAIVSKYIARTHATNIFNPAALGLVITFYLFNTGQSWWGALPRITPWALVLLAATGVFITDRVNKMPLVLVFLAAHFGLFTLATYAGDPRINAEIFRAPDLHAALFFAFFILTDPPTSPVRYPDQIVCGVLVALVAFAIFQWVGAAYYLLAGVLVGNVWEAWHRWYLFSRRRIPSVATSH